MATYIYETIPSSEAEEPTRFELKQSMNDDPLTQHPESGAPVKRVITGGYGFNVSGSEKSAPMPSTGSSCCQSGGCGCA
jgi:predicted nucleic acid-binding Zn ribbon protein|tara:strand:+ start:653 stop:889 length:237 start_codon:yes stop_codon:yes gene_type:complete